MAGVRLKLNIKGFNEFRNSAGVTAALEEIGAQMKDAATANNRFHSEKDEPFRATTVHNRSRVVVFVATNNFDGILAETTDRTLSKAVAT